MLKSALQRRCPCRFSVSRLGIWGICVAIGAGVGCENALAQTIHAVAPISGGSLGRVYAVNANGTAAAGYSDNASSLDNAIRWTNVGGTVGMGLLPGGVFNSYAQAIDSTGTILAGYGDSGSTRAFRWTTGGGFQLLPVVPGTGNTNQALGISQNGSVVVGTSGVGAAAVGFVWNSASPGSVINIGVLPGNSSAALAVSGDGSTVVGVSGNSAVRWVGSPSPVLSGLPGVPGQIWQRAEAVNTNGTVITGRYSNGSELGFRWTQATGSVALPQTPNGCTALRPRAINGDGTEIIGQVVDNVAGFTCFIWTPAKGTQLLTTHLQQRAVNMTGWQITDATGISADGSAMCGHGIYNGNAVGWVARGLPCANLNSPIGAIGDNGCLGGSAFMQVNFSFQVGTTPSFRWWKNGVQLADGVQPSGATFTGTTTNTLNMSNVQSADAGAYTVGISAQGACEVVSAPYNFAGPATPTVVNSPVNTTDCIGGNPFLFAAATHPAGGVTFRWQKLVTPPNVYADIFDGASGNGSTFFGTGTTTFSILGAQPADSTRYRCVFGINGCGAGNHVISSNAVLTVRPNTSIAVEPADTSGCPGDNDASFSVVAAPIGASFTYQWQKHQPPFPNVYVDIFDGPTGNGGSYGGTQSATLSINGLYPGDFDRYRCVVTGPCGFAATTVKALLSAVPEAIITSGPTPVAACEGGVGSLSVSATPGGSTYQWQKYVGPCILCYDNVANGPTGNGGTYSGAQSPTLTINGLSILDTVTTFRCIVTGPCGLVPAASNDGAYALMDAPFIQTQPVGGPVCRTGTKQLSIALSPGNYGNISYQWWRYVPAFPIFAGVFNGTLPSGAVASGAQSPTLTLSNFKSQDAGQYYCWVTSDCGIALSSVVTITDCGADYNCSGTVSVQDIFDFLAGYFAGDPNADFNGSNVISVQDIFDFLAAFFAGC